MRCALVLLLLAAAPARAQPIASTADACPDAEEDVDGIQDEDGCPEHGVKLAADRIELLDPIYFSVGNAELLPQSRPTLDAAAALLKKQRKLTIEVQAHTDSRGSDAFNLAMSQQRADAVRAYLVAAGVAARRVRATGYGETMPVDSNATELGRLRNRRVEIRLDKRR